MRLTADDLPMTRTRVDLGPKFVDEYGFPAACITRELGLREWQMFILIQPEMARVVEPFKKERRDREPRDQPGGTVTVVANALRVGTLIADTLKRGCAL